MNKNHRKVRRKSNNHKEIDAEYEKFHKLSKKDWSALDSKPDKTSSEKHRKKYTFSILYFLWTNTLV